MSTFEKLTALLNRHQARYRIVEHKATGKCAEVAALRGTELGQGAKALVCHVKGNGVKQHVLAVLPADKQANLAGLLEKSMVLNAEDYRRICAAQWVGFSR
ncbi:YbaK/EbsC family protein [Erwinia amylovora]|uniref:YbaK/EbsC family protein n=1 Tax=Erwinia amylovora TaxID=552 RepID=UPI0014445395|nr:YbaK/EbsC family protein [Erwinia amylovora]